ncbi:hypothetical protein K1719_008982 [Acacia pycnantha]|nr:hypothetical protein K1719_008982 [Acacia pycnantha]
MDEKVPLVIREVNPEAMENIKLGMGKWALIANPNCSKHLNLFYLKLHEVKVLPIFPWLVGLPLEKFQMASCTTGISKGL